MWKIRHGVCTRMYCKPAPERRHDRATRNERSDHVLKCHLRGRKGPLERRSRPRWVRGWIRENKRVSAPAFALYVFSITSTQRQQLPRIVNHLQTIHFVL